MFQKAICLLASMRGREYTAMLLQLQQQSLQKVVILVLLPSSLCRASLVEAPTCLTLLMPIYSKLSLEGHSMQGQSRCKDNAIGNKSL